MKKIRNTILIVLSFVIILTGVILALHFSQKNKLEETFQSASTTQRADDILLSSEKIKAKQMPTALYLKEKSDLLFDIENQKTKKLISSIDNSFYSSVFLKANSLSSDELSSIQAICESLKGKNRSVFIECSAKTESENLKKIALFSDGFLFSVSQKDSINDVQKKLDEIKEFHPEKKIYLKFSVDYDFSSLAIKNADGIFLSVSKKSETQNVKNWDAFCSTNALSLTVCIDFEKTETCDTALKILQSLDSLGSFSLRVFGGYSEIKENKDNCFGAVKKYITEGINSSLSLRSVGVTGYDGTVAETSDFTKEIEVYGSDLFPVYMNGKKITLDENASKKITLNLNEGENVYSFTQGESKIDYKINFAFTGEIIQTILPLGEITVQPDEEIKIMIVAFSKAEISIKIGTQIFEAKPAEKDKLCYTVFVARATMPSTYEEISSLGLMTIIASYNDISVQQKGAMIIAGQEITTTAPIIDSEGSTELQSTTRLVIENYVPDLPSEAYTTPAISTTAPTTPHINTAPIQNGAFTGTQMCVVSVPYAETRPLYYSDDTYVPYFTPLIAGTMDYVVAESEAYNKEEDEMVYFYELASGRKVKREDVQLIERLSLPSNSLNVLSSNSNNGTLKITLSTSWKVPYSFEYTPQNYFSAYGKLFNVSSFTASHIRFSFYHTGTASGVIDCKGSDIVSGASWGTEGNTITLTMPLRTAGVYYGYSLEYDANGNMVITIHNKVQSLAGSVILLDPGHGGSDPGALGFSGAVHEKDLNYAIAYYTKLSLESKGATVYLTRGGDTALSLEERKAIARSLKPDLFVAIHNNGSTNKNEIGTSAYYYKPFSQKLANCIYNNLLSVFKNNLYYGQTSLYDDIADGTIYYPFSVARLEDCPSVLVEVGFVTNDNECYMLTQTNNQQLLASAIADGIEDYVVG